MSSLFNMPRAAALLALAGTLFAVAPAAHANYQLVYNNLGSPTVGSDPALSYVALANSFNTGANGAGFLGAVRLLLTNGGPDIVGNIKVSLHADGSKGPGAELLSLGEFSSTQVSTSPDFSILSFTASSSYLLAANTTYWVEISNLSPNAIEWAWSTDITAPGVAGQYSYSQIMGKNANADWGPYQMSVSVPEPGSLVLVALGLGLVAVNVRKNRNA